MENFDDRYNSLVQEFKFLENISFSDKILLSTSKNRLMVAILEGHKCNRVESSHLSNHLLLAEEVEHLGGLNEDILKIDVNSILSEFRGPEIENINNLTRYHYDIFRYIVDKLSAGKFPTCSNKLIAAGIMYVE